MPEQDFKPFAGQSGANVVSQALYAASSYLSQGFTSGISSSSAFNKVFRQGTVIASAVAQAIADCLGVNVIDDGTTATIETNFIQLIRSGGALYVTDTGTANTLVCTLSPAPPSLNSMIGVSLIVKVAAANTGASTLNLNAFGGISILTNNLGSLPSSTFAAGGIAVMIFDGTQFQVIS